MLSVIVRKFQTLIKNPRKALAYRFGPFLRPLFGRWHRFRLSRKVDLSIFKRRPPQAIKPVFSDLWFLYSQVRKNDCQTVLEYGSGCSTYVIAQALFDNAAARQKAGRGSGVPIKFVSLDDDAYWADAARALIPDALKGMVEILHRDRVPVDFKGEKCWRYNYQPDFIPQFVYLDGPTFNPDRKIAIDFLDYCTKVPDNFRMVIDGRYENTAFLKREIGASFLFSPRYLFSNTLVCKKI